MTENLHALVTLLGTCKGAELSPKMHDGTYHVRLRIEGDLPHEKAVEEWLGAELGILQRHDRPVLVGGESQEPERDRVPDVMLYCIDCECREPHRWRPSPEAGPFFRCSACCRPYREGDGYQGPEGP